MTPPLERPKSNENLSDLSPENTTSVFEKGFQKAQDKCGFLGRSRRLAYEKSGTYAKGLKSEISPIQYLNIYVTHVFNGANRRLIGSILPEKEHLKSLKSSDEIAREITKMANQFVEEEVGHACKINSPEEYRCADFSVTDKTGGRILVNKLGYFSVDGKKVRLNGDNVSIVPATTSQVIFKKGDAGYIYIEMYDKGKQRPETYTINTAKVQKGEYGEEYYEMSQVNY